MKVIHIYRTYFPDTQGGLEEVIRQICKNTIEHSISSTVLTLSRNPEPYIIHREEAEVLRFKQNFEIASCGFSIDALRNFKRIVSKYDIVHYHFPWPFGDVLHFSGFINKPSIVTYHSDIVRQKSLLRAYRPLMRAFLNSVNVIVPTSQNYFVTSEELGRYAEKVEVIPIGLDSSSYPQVSNDAIERARSRVGENFFLFVGVLRYYKGLHILLDALHGTSLKCVIVGAGPVESELKRHAARLGLDQVHFLGHVSDSEKVALMTLCRAVVFSSHLRSEAFGVTLLEGAMHAKPLISTEIGTGTSYINVHNETGLVVPPNSSKQLREAMLLLDQDEGLALKMGKAAHSRYEALFTGRLMGLRYARLYNKLYYNNNPH